MAAQEEAARREAGGGTGMDKEKKEMMGTGMGREESQVETVADDRVDHEVRRS